jgi:hypothetical protein
MCSNADTSGIFDIIGQYATIWWRDWPRDMQAVAHDSSGNFALTGTCPYPKCNRPTVFVKVQGTSVGIVIQGRNRWVAILRCQGCQSYILGIVDQPQSTQSYLYLEHYPLGSPDETVAAEIPTHIQDDFKEALRCLWIKAYNATAEMCRRALEAACLELGAPKNKVLEKMIDWLEENRTITPYLKKAAHKVRLGGNRGAHPPEDGPKPEQEAIVDGPVEKIEKEHAEAIVEFTREFFHHVYVGPKLLGKYDFSKPKPQPIAPTN